MGHNSKLISINLITKFLLIIFLGLLFYNTSFADNLKVIDGDTIKINGERIRFSGIDAPETNYLGSQNLLWKIINRKT